VSEEAVQALAAALRPNGDRADKPALPEALIRLLTVRGVRDPETAKQYLRPDRAHLTPPESLTDLTRAAERLVAAVRAGEMILVHGDYDVDGICSTALLTRVLRAVGAQVTYFIPDRKRDGYDLGPAGVAKAREVGASVVLTCDCGTTAVEPARALRAAGVDLIITDHHRLGAEVPVAYALVNPQREPDVATRADRHMAAVGVAWKLASVVSGMLDGDAKLLDDQLELVALATVADVVPLVDDNRILVAEGLKLMQAPRNVGLRQLIRSASLDAKRVTAGRLGFTVAPRLNALGRVREALTGVELLLEEDEERATELARLCNEANAERQTLDRDILDQAKKMLETRDIAETRGIVLHGVGWEPGVIGIVASRIVEWTHRPTFMIAVTHDGTTRVGKGSGRSIPGFDLHAALTACGDLLVKFGGHRAAAGLTIAPERIPEFAARFDAVARSRLSDDDLVPEIRTDGELEVGSLTTSFVEELQQFEPFGAGNAAPRFVVRGLKVRSVRRQGKFGGRNVDLETAGGSVIRGYVWSECSALQHGRVVDVVLSLNGESRDGLSANIIDAKEVRA